MIMDSLIDAAHYCCISGVKIQYIVVHSVQSTSVQIGYEKLMTDYEGKIGPRKKRHTRTGVVQTATALVQYVLQLLRQDL